MKCNKCNCELSHEYKFCPNCGSEITIINKAYDPFEVPEKMPAILKVSLIAIIVFVCLVFGLVIIGSVSLLNKKDDFKAESNIDYDYNYDYDYDFDYELY